MVQDLVHLGFELYSTEGTDDKPASVQVQAFDQLFQKMNLGRPFAIMAYKYLTDVRRIDWFAMYVYSFLCLEWHETVRCREN